MIYSFNSRLNVVTGVQKVMYDIHKAIRDVYDSKIVGFQSYKELNTNLHINKEEYVQWRNPFKLRNSVVIVHERKFLVLFWFLNHFLWQRIKVIYIHHNMLYGHKLLTILPKTVICISDRGCDNLINEFGVSKDHIFKISNCTEDRSKRPHRKMSQGKITILYPARINSVKRQIELTKRLSGRLSDKVQILFAGDGPLFETFRMQLSNESANFKCLGFVSDMDSLYENCDFVMLFSKHEGLPISLIEAAMFGLPIICNSVGGNTEIAYNNKNAIVVDEWEELIDVLNDLPEMTNDIYLSMCRNSRKIYEEKFTFDKFRDCYLDLLSKLS